MRQSNLAFKTEIEPDEVHIDYEFKTDKISEKEVKKINIKEVLGMVLVVSIFMAGFMYVMMNLDKFCTIYR